MSRSLIGGLEPGDPVGHGKGRSYCAVGTPAHLLWNTSPPTVRTGVVELPLVTRIVTEGHNGKTDNIDTELERIIPICDHTVVTFPRQNDLVLMTAFHLKMKFYLLL